MKITIGIDQSFSISDIVKLAELGADEFFFGVMPPDWTAVYGYTVSTNRRYSIQEHYIDWDRMNDAVSAIHKAGKKAIVAFNALYYINDQMPLLLNYVKQSCDIGADALIVSDMELLLRILELDYKVDIHISSESGDYNSHAAALFASLGIQRIIFPRHMTIAEMQTIILNNKNLECECFIMEQRCPFDGAYCTPTHGWHRNSFCHAGFQRAIYKYAGDDAVDIVSPAEYLKWKTNRNHYEIWAETVNKYHSILTMRDCYVMQCGLCGIKRLGEIGMSSLKIASRGCSKEIAFLSVELVKKVLSSSDKSEEFCRNVRAHPEICDLKYMCYYR